MTYTAGTITSLTPAKDLMNAVKAAALTAGLTLVESYQAPAGFTWNSVTYGNGVFVAVGNSGVCATSPDGVTWTYRAMPDTLHYSGVAYGNGLFVAIVTTTASTCVTSPDGITWTYRTMPSSQIWNAVTYGGGQFVAVASGVSIGATSPDGITWTQRAMSISASWCAIAYGNSMYVAVPSASGAVAASSPDGATWTTRTLPTSQAWSAVAYGNGVFVAVASAAGTAATSSPDGITWTARTIPTGTWKSVTFGNGVFVAVGSGGTNSAATSPDGVTWTARSLPSTGTWNSVTYANSTFVAVKVTAAAAATSPDGVTWTAQVVNVSNSTQPTADVYKSPGAGNSFGSDWYLILRRSSDASPNVFYQVAESYNSTTHLMSGYGGMGITATPVAVTFANPGAAVAPDVSSGIAATANLQTTTTIFSYWVSVSVERLVVGIKTSTETGFYAGLYDDLLPAGVTQFPLVCAKLPTVITSSQAIGGGGANATGGFTREPLQGSASALNFEAAIHNSYVMGPGSAFTSLGFTPLTDNLALYGNLYGLSRVMVGSARVATTWANAVRGLLKDCVCSNVTSLAGDTFTAGSKTYARFGGPTTTWGIFVDTGV